MRIYPSGRLVRWQLWWKVSTPTFVWLPLSNVQKCCFCHSFFFFLVCVLFLHLLFFVPLLSCVAFAGARAFNADITHWNVGAVTDMSYSKSSKKNILFLSQYSKTSMHFFWHLFYNHFHSPCSVLLRHILQPYPLQSHMDQLQSKPTPDVWKRWWW